jgi:hypothetical protein
MFKTAFEFAMNTSFRSLIRNAKPKQKILLQGSSMKNLLVVVDEVHDDMIIAHSPDKQRCVLHRASRDVALDIQGKDADGAFTSRRHMLKSVTMG